MAFIEFSESGWVPNWLIRFGIRRLLRRRLRQLATENRQGIDRERDAFVAQLRTSPLAVSTDAANIQHYEVPAEFFERALGPRLKYSACYFATPAASLVEAEVAMLRKTVERAEIKDGMRVLELGCGWGSFTLWLAENMRGCTILGVTNSRSQREYIQRRANQRGLTNVSVEQADMREFNTEQRFDRVVSIEMFEHMRNYELLLRRVASWLALNGKLFVHIFCHRQMSYLFEADGAANWMGRNFFTGGMMPAVNLLREFSSDLTIERQWSESGVHYQRTCEAWLENLDRHRAAVTERFAQDCPAREARRRVQQWRMFFMACAELFGYHGGDEWFVAHYLLSPRPVSTLAPSAGRGNATLPG